MSAATHKWRSRIVGQGEEDPSQLLANPSNWRIHPEHQQQALEGVLGVVGWVQQVVVNQRTGHIVDGHLRVTLALRHNEATIPVLYVDLDEDEEKLILATLDNITGMAAPDTEMLESLLREIHVQDDKVNTLLQDIADRYEIQTAEMFDDLVEGVDFGDLSVGFEVSVMAKSPSERDDAVSALEEIGLDPVVKTVR